MKKLLLTSFLFTSCFIASAQRLILEKTQFLGAPSICYDAIATDDHGILFTGFFDGNFGGTIPNCSYQLDNTMVGKLDSNLQIKWISVLAGNQVDRGRKLCRGADGSYIVLAESASTDGDFTTNYGTGGTRDLWLIKLDDNGNRIWSKNYGSPADDIALSIAATADSGFIILGASNGYGNDIPFHYTTSQFVLDWFVVKVDKDGNKQWCKTIGGNGDEWGKGSILVVNDGYYIASGSNSKDHDCFDTSWHPANVNTGYDVFLLKLDTAGNVLWNRSYGGSEAEVGTWAKLDPVDSSIIIAATSASNDYQATGNHSINLNKDMWILKTDKYGNLLWSRMCGGAGDEETNQIIKKLSDGSYIAITTTFPGNYGTENLWAFNLDKDGNILFDYQFGGKGNDIIENILSTQTGLIIDGYSTSTTFNQGTTSGRNGVGQQTFFMTFDYFHSVIKKFEEDKNVLSVYPNPTGNETVIELPKDDNIGRLEIYNTDGKCTYSSNVQEQSRLKINTIAWPKGIYEIIWKTASTSYSSNLICK